MLVRTTPENPAVASFMEAIDRRDKQPHITQSWLQSGTKLPIYGPFATRLVEGADKLVRGQNTDPRLLIPALISAAQLISWADRRNRFPARKCDEPPSRRPLTDKELKRHQKNVLNRIFELVPSATGTSIEEGLTQVETANRQPQRIFNSDFHLAEITDNVFLRHQALAGGHRLSREEINEVVSTEKDLENPLLAKWALGQTVEGIYRTIAHSNNHNLRIVDIGSGRDTVDALLYSILSVENIDNRPELAFTGLEISSRFHEELVNFANNNRRLRRLKLQRSSLPRGSREPLSQPGVFTTSHITSIDTLLADPSVIGRPNDVTVITGNYSWGNFDSQSKARLLERYAQSGSNVIFLVGDSAVNGSKEGRRYFNLAGGPLYYGNRGLSQQFRDLDYALVDFSRVRPLSLALPLSQRLSKNSNDGPFWIAYLGPLAEQALNLVPAA